MLSELNIINLFNKRTRNRSLLRGIGDDAAVFGHPNDSLKWVVTQDLMSEGTHFRLDWITPQDLAYKIIAVNLSDLAAMGAHPQFLLLSLGIPTKIPDIFLKKFSRAFHKICREQKVALIGGDTCESAHDLWLQVTAIGQAKKTQIAYRTGAKAGDPIYVTGSLGASALGLYCLEYGIKTPLIKRHHRPPVLTEFAHALAQRGFASSMTDVSDGLLLDLETLCGDKLTACIEADKVPIDLQTRHTAKKHALDPLSFALGGGEDYELIFTVRKSQNSLFHTWAKSFPHITHIGHMIPSKDSNKLIVLDTHQHPLSLNHLSKGYIARR